LIVPQQNLGMVRKKMAQASSQNPTPKPKESHQTQTTSHRKRRPTWEGTQSVVTVSKKRKNEYPAKRLRFKDVTILLTTEKRLQ